MASETLMTAWTSPVVAWLSTYAIHSTILIGVVWLLTARARRLSERSKDVLWKVGLVGGLVTATVQSSGLLTPLAGQLRLPGRWQHRPVREMRVMVIAQRSGDLSASQIRGSELLEPPFALPIPPPSLDPLRLPLFDEPVRDRTFRRRASLPWASFALWGWLVGAVGALVRLMLAHARLARRLRRRSEEKAATASGSLDRLLVAAGVRRRVRLTASTEISSPVALPGAEICLPQWVLCELGPTEQEIILAHEVAHIARRDPAWLIAGRILEAVFFFQPLNRLARRRIQETAEFLCDDWAVERTGQPVALAKCLASVAAWLTPFPEGRLVAAMVESGGSPLVRRVARILDSSARRRSRPARAALAFGGSCLIALTWVAPGVSAATPPAEAAGPQLFFLGRVREGGSLEVEDVLRLRTERVLLKGLAAPPVGARVIVEEWNGGTVTRVERVFGRGSTQTELSRRSTQIDADRTISEKRPASSHDRP